MLDSGTKNGAVVASWGSQYGLSITGSAKNTPKDDYDHPLNTLLRWSKTIDLKDCLVVLRLYKGLQNNQK